MCSHEHRQPKFYSLVIGLSGALCQWYRCCPPCYKSLRWVWNYNFKVEKLHGGALKSATWEHFWFPHVKKMRKEKRWWTDKNNTQTVTHTYTFILFSFIAHTVSFKVHALFNKLQLHFSQVFSFWTGLWTVDLSQNHYGHIDVLLYVLLIYYYCFTCY